MTNAKRDAALPTGGAWDEYKVVDGVRLYRGDCNICGSEFYHKNPYRKWCPDKAAHRVLHTIRRPKPKPKKTREAHKLDEWSGSWDNCVKVREG